MANHLQLQGGTWHVRLEIPTEVRSAFGGRRILSKSLGTGQRSEAMNLRLPYLAQWKAEIAAARALTVEVKVQLQQYKEGWKPQLAEWGHEVDKKTSGRFMEVAKGTRNTKDLAPEDREAAKRKVLEELYELAAGLEAKGVPGVVAFIDKKRLEMPDSPLERVQHASEFNRELMVMMTASHYELNEVETAEAKAIAFEPSSYKPKSPITKARLAKFREVREQSVALRNVDQQESKLKKLSSYLAETGKPLDFDTVAKWLDSLGVESKTKAQYITAGGTFWKWAMKYDAQWREDFKGAVNPFDHHELPQLRGKAKADTQRLDFSLSELAQLHTAAITEGNDALADLILLATYTGARIEELCQLRTENVVTDDGVQSFDITDSKTVAGIRVVPVHPALTNLVQRLMTDSQDGYLVPSDSKNKYGNRSDLHSKAFGRLKKSQGFGSRHVFHSIRKTAITQLHRAEVLGPLIAELVGHETGTVTFDTYSQGASAAQKLTAISKIPALPDIEL
ncbi:tyrosine-type recombinase/integrase [Pseudomonas monteilii]|uniref:tyrosine-type recombinase/integrase n=1 Tax=Pseudomonas monteilii TaxID=76759 RepID=UPI0036E3C446